MVQFDQHHTYYLKKQFEIGFSIVLAIVSSFFLLSFIIECLWNKNKNSIINILITKILFLKHKNASNEMNKSQKHELLSKLTSSKETNKLVKNQHNPSKQLLNQDPIMKEVLHGSSLKEFLKDTIESCSNGKYREIKKLLGLSQSIQALSVYQPFLILFLLIFNMSQVIFVVPIQQNNGNMASQEPQDINSSDYSKQYYATIAMIAISVIVFLVLNASNSLITFINHWQIKKNKIPEYRSSNCPQNQIPMVLSEKKVVVDNVKKEEIEPEQKIRRKDLTNGDPKLSFKMQNSLNLLHLLHIIPLFVCIGIIISLRF